VLPKPATGGCYFVTLGLAWGAVLVLSLVGWGGRIAGVLLPGAGHGWAIEGALGLAAAVAAGGVLNLAGAISRPLLLALVGGGLILYVERARSRRGDIGREPRRWLADLVADRTRAGLLFAVAVLLSLQLAGSLHGTVSLVSTYRDFDHHDDRQAYLVFPMKMLELGGMGEEPYDARRLISLGGQSFLQTLVLAALPLRSIHMLDGGIALLLCIGILATLLRRLEVAPRLRALVLLFAVLVPQLAARGNTTAVLSGAALLLAWFHLQTGDLLPLERPVRNGLAIALLASAMCALKPTLIPAAVFFFAFSQAALLLGSRARASSLAETVTGAVVVFALLSPWMLALFRSSGTLLFPIFGQGNYGAASTQDFAAVQGDFSQPLARVLEHVRGGLLRVLPVFALVLAVRERSRRRPALAVTLAAAAVTVFLVLVVDPNLERSIYRYSFPVVFAATVAVLASALATDDGARARSPGKVATVLAAMLIAFAPPDTLATACMTQPVRNIVAAFSRAPLENAAHREEAGKLQEAVPPGEPILARVPFPFLFDLRRNPVYIYSLPAMASPPPGIPTFEGAEAVARYLDQQGIRYLAYGARNARRRLLNLTEDDIDARYPGSRVRRVMLVYHREFEENVLELARTRVHLADSHESFVLDLATRVAPDPAGESVRVRPERIGDKTGVLDDNNWTTGDATLRGVGLPVAAGHRWLVVALGPAHPFRHETQRLAVRVWSQGRELPAAGTHEATLLFELPAEVDLIDDLRIVSSTFVPRRLGLGDDARTLGIPIEWISTR